MLGGQLAHGVEVHLGTGGGHIQQEVLGEGAVLDVGQNLLHGLLGLGGDDLGAGDVVAVLGGVGDGVAHTAEAGLVNEVNDQLHLMDALEIGVSGIVAGLAQGLKARLHQGAHAAAQNGLLTEEVGLGLGAEVSLQHAGTGTADAQRVSQADVPGIAGGILLHGNQAGYTLACQVLAAHGVAGALGGDHDDVHVLGGLDAAEVDVEAVGEGQSLAGSQVGLDALLVQGGLLLVVNQDHDDIGGLGGFRGGHDGHALGFGLGPALGAGVQTDDDVHAALLQVKSVGVTLGAVADDGNGLAGQLLKVTVLLIKNTVHGNYPFFDKCASENGWGLQVDFADGGGASLEGDNARPADFENFILLHQGDEVVDLPAVADHLDDDGILGEVHDLALVGIGGGADLSPDSRVIAHLDEQQLPADGVQVVQLRNGHHVRKLIELVDKLLLLHPVPFGTDGDPGEFLGLGFGDGQGDDVELTAAEHAGDPVQNAELIVDQNGYRKCFHISHRSL